MKKVKLCCDFGHKNWRLMSAVPLYSVLCFCMHGMACAWGELTLCWWHIMFPQKNDDSNNPYGSKTYSPHIHLVLIFLFLRTKDVHVLHSSTLGKCYKSLQILQFFQVNRQNNWRAGKLCFTHFLNIIKTCVLFMLRRSLLSIISYPTVIVTLYSCIISCISDVNVAKRIPLLCFIGGYHHDHKALHFVGNSWMRS